MKNYQKTLILLMCAVMLVAGSVFGTFAYLTDNDSVTNTFTVGKVGLKLDETDVDPMGVKAGETRVTENTYHLLPGHTYIKDPKITVDEGSEDCYLFVTVVNEISAIEATDNTVAAQMTEKGWKAVDGVANTYVYIGTEAGASAPLAVTAESEITVFQSFKIDGDKVVNVPEDELPDGKINLSAYAGKTIVVTAYAVQKDGFENSTALEIWNTALKK